MSINKVSVYGLGYIGLPTAVLIADKGIETLGVDIKEDLVKQLSSGEFTIDEKGLDSLIQKTISNGKLTVSTKPKSADVHLIAVPTPFKDNKEPDLSYVKNVCIGISRVLKKGDLIIIESTCPVGTSERVSSWLSEKRTDLTFPKKDNCGDSDVNIAYCPERVIPGNIIYEMINNHRIIGGITKICSEKAKLFYKKFVAGDCIITNSSTAEMSKLVENSFRDVNLAFANEISIICNKMNIDVWELITLCNYHPRVNILKPGPGVGGHCIAVDPWFIIDSSRQEAKLISLSRNVNLAKEKWAVDKILSEIEDPSDNEIACFGLSYKPNIDDLRESPAINIVNELIINLEKKILVVEPNINELPKKIINNVSLVDVEYALSTAKYLILLVPHSEFKSHFSSGALTKNIIDICGMTSEYNN